MNSRHNAQAILLLNLTLIDAVNNNQLMLIVKFTENTQINMYFVFKAQDFIFGIMTTTTRMIMMMMV